MGQKIVIVNTGCANISSVRYAVERLAANVEVSDNADVIAAADKVFLPGVGNASAAMDSIRTKQLIAPIQSLTQPVLGICLGMQLMVSSSEEGARGNTECLGLIPGTVTRMQVGERRLPHMGWNTVSPAEDAALFRGLDADTYFYFVHSFSVATSAFTHASCEYGQRFSASLHKDNFYGVQFHPERSGEAGAQLLENFLSL